jgi:hypothetical protein
MSNGLASLFRLNAVITFVFGAPLLLFPGAFLGAFGWTPVDPILTRILGAALLAMTWSSFQVVRINNTSAGRVLIEMEALFCVLGGIGVLRQLLLVDYPLMVWSIFGILVIFGVFWILAWNH